MNDCCVTVFSIVCFLSTLCGWTLGGRPCWIVFVRVFVVRLLSVWTAGLIEPLQLHTHVAVSQRLTQAADGRARRAFTKFTTSDCEDDVRPLIMFSKYPNCCTSLSRVHWSRYLGSICSYLTKNQLVFFQDNWNNILFFSSRKPDKFLVQRPISRTTSLHEDHVVILWSQEKTFYNYHMTRKQLHYLTGERENQETFSS